MSKLGITLSNDTIAWVRETAGIDAPIYEASDGEDLKRVIDKNNGQSFAVVVPSRTESKWWAELVGATHEHIAFLQGRPKGSSVGLAVVLYNTAKASQEIPDATVTVPKLLEMGYTGKSLADELGVGEMTISRANTRRNHYYDERLLLNKSLYDFYLKAKKGEA